MENIHELSQRRVYSEVEGIYLILEGHCRVGDRILSKGEFFGGSDLIRVSNYYSDLVADDQVTCLFASSSDIDSKIPSYDLKQIAANSGVEQALTSASPLFSELVNSIIN